MENLQTTVEKQLSKYKTNKSNLDKDGILKRVNTVFLTNKAQTMEDFTEYTEDQLFTELKDQFTKAKLIGKGNKYNSDGVNSLRIALQSKLESNFNSGKYQTLINGKPVNSFCKVRGEIVYIESDDKLIHFVVNPKVLKVKDVLQNSEDTSDIDYTMLKKVKKIIENNVSLKPEQVTK